MLLQVLCRFLIAALASALTLVCLRGNFTINYFNFMLATDSQVRPLSNPCTAHYMYKRPINSFLWLKYYIWSNLGACFKFSLICSVAIRHTSEDETHGCKTEQTLAAWEEALTYSVQQEQLSDPSAVYFGLPSHLN